jgi:hypothetical protein
LTTVETNGRKPGQVIAMLSDSKTAVLHRHTAAPEQSRVQPAYPVPLHALFLAEALVKAAAIEQEPHLDDAAPTPALITECPVTVTSPAAAAPRPAAAFSPWLWALWQRLVRSAGCDHRSQRRYPPRRASYFENAAMAREMDRL